VILLAAILYCAGCNPSGLPGIKEYAKRQEEEEAKYTEEVLKESPVMRELDRLCSKEIPLFDGFVLLSKHAYYPRKPVFLTYHYQSEADYQKVKVFYEDYFEKNGWQFTNQKENGWGPDELKFRNDKYQVIISHGDMGNVDYAFDCEMLPDSDEDK
jgi:hypothetical protein